MKIFTAALITETNTFAPYPTGLATFEEMMLLRAGEEPDPPHGFDLCQPYIKEARALGWEMAVGLRAFAMPSGLVTAACYEALRNELLSDLRAALPVDAVLLSLHGAMASVIERDCEGDVIARVREMVGSDIPIGVHIDPHCHLTDRMVDNADVIRIWKEYPHTDITVRAKEVFQLIKARLDGAPRAIPVVYSCGMTNLFHTTRQPMRGFVDKVTELEGKDGIQTISIAHSFPWGDVEGLGAKILIYCEGEAYLEYARLLAAELGEEFYQLRERAGTPYLSIDDALDLAYQTPDQLSVISDGPDNPGIGSPGDSTFILSRLLEREEKDWALGYIFDPGAAALAIEAGIGAQVTLRVGGKVCALSGAPVDVTGTVVSIEEGARVKFGQQTLSVGNAVSIDLGLNRHLLLISLRNQTFDHELFGRLGIDLKRKTAVVVKSSQHFYASFVEIADHTIYAAPDGVATPELNSLEYKFADPTLWPFKNAASAF